MVVERAGLSGPVAASPQLVSLPGSFGMRLSQRDLVLQKMADETTTAQVHPEKLTNALLDSAKDNGAVLQIGTVEGLRFDDSGAVQSKPPSWSCPLRYLPCGVIVQLVTRHLITMYTSCLSKS